MRRYLKRKDRLNNRLAIRSLLEEHSEDRVCGECGYPIWLYSNPHTYKGFLCPKYPDNSIVDCWD
jgi:ribosomal protein S27AE